MEQIAHRRRQRQTLAADAAPQVQVDGAAVGHRWARITRGAPAIEHLSDLLTGLPVAVEAPVGAVKLAPALVIGE